MVPHESGQSCPGFLVLQWVLETLQDIPRPPCVGQCIDFSSVPGKAFSLLPSSHPSSPTLSAGASCPGPWLSICFLPLPSARGAAPGLLPGSLPLTRRLPDALLLCHQFGSAVPLPTAHSRAFLSGVLSNSWHPWPGAGPGAGDWSSSPGSS